MILLSILYRYYKGVTYFIKSRELKESFFDRAVVVNMNCVFKHVVQEVGIRFNELVEGLQIYNVPTLLLVKQVEVHFKTE